MIHLPSCLCQPVLLVRFIWYPPSRFIFRADQIMAFRISRSQRLLAVIAIACSFFLAEISGMWLSCFNLLGMNGLSLPWLDRLFWRTPNLETSETLTLTLTWLDWLTDWCSWILYAFSGVGGRCVSLCMFHVPVEMSEIWWRWLTIW